MTIKFYDLVGADEARFSPYGWRVRLALAAKGMETDAEWVPVKFTDKDKIAFSGQKLVPVLVEGETVVNDSFAICRHLAAAHPDGTAIFPGGEALHRAITLAIETSLNPALLPIVIGPLFDRIHPDDRAYFRETREKRLGRTIEEMAAAADQAWPGWWKATTPYERTLDSYAFLSGEAPGFADFVLAGMMQWARLGAGIDPMAETPAIRAWFDRFAATPAGAPIRAAA